jgi:hypothetical protein
MNISFTTSIDLDRTMIFEQLFEPELRLELEEKQNILRGGSGIWMLVDGELAGETFAATPYALAINGNEKIEDTDPLDDESWYVYSTALLKPYQGGILSLAPILVSCFMGYAKTYTEKLIGHVTTERMKRLRSLFGATFGAKHENWCGSKRTAEYYEQPL